MRAGSVTTQVGEPEAAVRIAVGARARGPGSRPWPRRLSGWLAGWLAPLLAIGLLLAPAPLRGEGEALAIDLPGWTRPAARRGGQDHNQPGPGLGAARAGQLQEVAPPPAVQQLQQALEQRQPQLSILAPADDTLLPAGPWTLRLRVSDWPLVDAGPLGLGPHVVVQLDAEPPRRLSGGAGPNGELALELPELSPGSHRLTVYAARPWGEAVKAPGSWRQIRLHRVRANPLTLPAAGSPQLLPVAPASPQAGQPVLLDWLLLDAPLQHLRPGDDNWRLRISVNGDSVLVDRQTPLWLEGWRSGENAIQLELVDLRGEPINPPFNSVVSALRLDPSLPRPAWLDRRLSERDLALLLGEALPEPEPEPEPAATVEPEPAAEAVPTPEPEREPETAPLAAAPTDPEPAADEPAAIEPDQAPAAAQTAPEPETVPAPKQMQKQGQEEEEPAPVPAATAPAEEPEAAAAGAKPATEPQRTPPAKADGPEAQNADRVSDQPPTPAEAPPVLAGSARAEVNPDGTLIRPERGGPMARLRQRLNGNP